MKTWYITRYNNIAIDTENGTCERLCVDRTAIDNIYVVKEPMHVVYNWGEYKKEFDVEENDIVISFWDIDFKNKVIVVKNTEWAENINLYNEKQQALKEEWASKNCDESVNV